MTKIELMNEIVKLTKEEILELARDLRAFVHEEQLYDELSRSADEAFQMLDELESNGGGS